MGIFGFKNNQPVQATTTTSKRRKVRIIDRDDFEDYVNTAIREVFDKCDENLLIAVEDTGYNLKYIKGDNILKCGVSLLEDNDVVSSKIFSDYADTLTELLDFDLLDDMANELVDTVI